MKKFEFIFQYRQVYYLTLLIILSLGKPVKAQITNENIPGTIKSLSKKQNSNKTQSPVNNSSLSILSSVGLQQVYSSTGHYTISTDGIGSNNISMNIRVNKPNLQATVQKAILLSTVTPYNTISNGCVTIAGAPVNWDGSAAVSFFTSYWADVTSLVTSQINAFPAGISTLPITECNTQGIDGEALLVVFNDPAATEKTIIIMGGAMNPSGDNFSVTLAQPIDPNQAGALLDMGLGIGFSYQLFGGSQASQVSVNGQRVTSSAGGEDDGVSANGALITVGGIGDANTNPPNPFVAPTNFRSDDELYNILPFITSTTTNLIINTINPSLDDNIFLAYFVMSGAAVIGEGILLSQTSSSGDVGTSHTIKAAVVNSLGQPITNRSVTFTITSGPNFGNTFSANTDANGEAFYTYTGTGGAGTDNIQACFTNSQNQLSCSNTLVFQWVAAASALSTSSLDKSSYCQNENINVPYIATGNYNVANTFTAQLSDGSGSFSSPTNIGSINSTSSGSIDATIPSNAPTGTHYRIRVVSSDPVVTGSDNSSDITINELPLINCPSDITIDATSGQCGANVNFSATGTGTISYSKLPGSFFAVGTTTVTVTATTACGSVTCNFNVTVNDKQAPTAVCKPYEVYLGLDGTAIISASDIDNGSNDNCGSVNLSLDKTSFTTTDLGANTVTLTVTDASGNSSTCQTTVTVTKRPTTLVYTGDGSEQYSDQQLLTAVLKDQLTNTVLSSKTISFVIGSQSASGTTNVNGIASTNLIITQDPAPVYTVKSNFAGDATFLPSSDEDAFDILQEDARAYYTGALMASTSGVNTSTATVTLSATVKDITAVSGDPAYDAFKGDIRNATVTFINRDNGSVLALNVPVGLVNLADITVGTATKNVTLDIGAADAKQFTIGIVVNNYYTRDASAENTIVTVSKPLDNFITGGGYIVLTNSAGQKAGMQGTNNNFGFNVKYNKNGTNLQGNMNTIIRRMEGDGILHVYQIKGNSMTSLAVNSSVSTSKTATFNGKASIQDITNPLAPVSVDGNATLQVTMTDRGEPGNTDDIGVTVWNKIGGLWYSSNWNGTKTVNQTLAGGNLKVNGASYNAASASTVSLKLAPEPTNAIPQKLELAVYPNPATHAFIISLKGNTAQKILVRVTDILGRVIEVKDNLASGNTIKLGENYRPGTYIIEAIQDNKKEMVKLIKLSE